MLEGEVVVVGGGPAGALAAWACAKKGAKTILLERAPNAQAACAGLISPETACALAVPKNLILREILGVRVFSPKGEVYEIRGEKPTGMVLDRTGLNRWLRGQAEEAGVVILPSEARAIRGKAWSRKKGKWDLLSFWARMEPKVLWQKLWGVPHPRKSSWGFKRKYAPSLGTL